ncbi:MAG: oligosaccharide flippase family protein [Patescibacteria group bacterium]|nr:oligosaccharide flippase family protein [Patescibacteria group bacterium]
MSSLFKVSQQTLWQLLGKAITSLATFIILGMVARNYNEAQTGIFTLALTYLAFFYLAVDFGLNALVLQRLDQEEGHWQKLLGMRFALSSILVTLAVLLVAVWPTDPLFRQSIFIGALAIVGYAAFTSSAVIFQSKLRYDLATLTTSVGALVTLPIFFLIVEKDLTVADLMIGHLLGWLVSGVFSLIIVKKYLPRLFPVFNFEYSKNLLKEIWPFSMTMILNVVYFRLDAFILSFFKTMTEVGVYNLGYQIFQALLVVPTFIMNGYYPLMLKKGRE